MELVHLHPLSGVLSAYGMGLADIRANRSRALVLPLAEGSTAAVDEAISGLVADAREELARQGLAEADTTIAVRAHIRYDGTDSAIPVPYGTAMSRPCATSFETEHRSRFGFVYDGKPW